jgi:Tfp pilus assembly protein PilX
MRPTSARPALDRLATLRTDERGIALALALMVVVALSISAAALSQLVASNETAYGRDRQEVRAFNAAEAGINNALAHLSTINGAAYLSQGPYTFTVEGNANGGSWSAVKAGTGASTYWTVTSQAKVGKVTRAVSVQVRAPETSSSTPSWGGWGYGFFVASPTGCTDMVGTAKVTIDVFIAANLCLNGTQEIGEPSSSGPSVIDVYIGGELSIVGAAAIGTNARKINRFTAIGGCKKNNVIRTCSTSAQSSVYANNWGSPSLTLTKPPIYPDTMYAKGRWSTPVCTVGSLVFDTDTTRNTSLASVNLLPAAAYDCTVYADAAHTTVTGRIAWVPGTKQLTATGLLYFDGNIVFGSNDTAAYTAGTNAAIYANGTVSTAGSSALCGPPATISATHPKTTCTGLWDAATGVISISAVNAGGAVPGFEMKGTSELNIAAYVVGKFVATGDAKVTGPVTTDTATIVGTADSTEVLNPPENTPGGPATVSSGSWGTVKPGTWRQLIVG